MKQQIMIRRSTPEDLGRIMPVYEIAKGHMRSEGNMEQWTGGYPSEEVILRDIAAGNHYLMEMAGIKGDQDSNEMGELAGVFTFIIGPDPTYSVIEGKWLNDEPYGTIHRIASAGIAKGLLRKCVDYCFGLIPNIRIDTHCDNKTMLAAINSLGFQRCGIIYLADGSPRVAFQNPK